MPSLDYIENAFPARRNIRLHRANFLIRDTALTAAHSGTSTKRSLIFLHSLPPLKKEASEIEKACDTSQASG
jgi:hypothetical protein